MDAQTNQSFVLRKLAEMPKDFVAPAGFRTCRVIVKEATGKKFGGKESVYCSLPEVSENKLQALMLSEFGKDYFKSCYEALENAIVRAKYLKTGTSVSELDLTIEEVAKIAAASASSERITKATIEAAFDSDWVNTLALSIALERDAEAALILVSEDQEQIAEFWAGQIGLRFLGIARNYKQFFLMAAERKPSFSSLDIQTKVLKAFEYLDADSNLVQHCFAKLKDAPIASVDSLAL